MAGYNGSTILVSGLKRQAGMDEEFPIVDSKGVYIRDRTSSDPTDSRKYIGLDEVVKNLVYFADV